MPPRAWGRNRRPLVIAHRGASAYAVENTLAAFRRARELGADGVELDTMCAATGEVLVFHDDDLTRLAGRPDLIRTSPFDALREVDLGGGACIPTLEQVIEECGPDLLINVELKSPERRGLQYIETLRDDGLAAAAARVLRRAPDKQRFLISSFDPVLLARFRVAAPEFDTALLFHRQLLWPLRKAWAAALLRPKALHPEAELVSAAAVELWHRAGYAVNVWTVDDPREIAWLAALGVDGIITNRPDTARAAVDQGEPSRPPRAG